MKPQKPRHKASTLTTGAKVTLICAALIIFGSSLLFTPRIAPEDPSAKDEYRSIDFYALSNFDYITPEPEDTAPPQNVIPGHVRALNGRRMAVLGKQAEWIQR